MYRDGTLVASPKKIKDSARYFEFDGSRYYDKDINPGTTYSYTVYFVGTDGTKSAASAPLSVTTPTDTTPVPDVTFEGDVPADLASLPDAITETLKTWYPKIADKLARPDYDVPTSMTLKFGDLSARNALGAADPFEHDHI